MEEMELIKRHEMFPHWVLYTLLATIVLLSILKYQRRIIYVHLRSAFFKSPAATVLDKEEIGFLGRTHWALQINYFVVSALAVYMTLIYFEINQYWLILVPTAYYFLQVFELVFVGMVSGEIHKLKIPLLLTNYTTHILGIVFIPILLIWILNPQFSEYILYALGFIFIFLQLIRILRSIFSAINNNILWYYIILYLCTFEIWSVIIFYVILSSNFFS